MVVKETSEERFAPDITVVIATYNRGHSLKKLLNTLSTQTLEADRFEVIVVDDGSEIPVESVLDDQNWPFAFTLIRQENAGAAAARHAGIGDSRGDIIVITDDDMEVRADFLEKHQVAHNRGADVVLGRIVQSSSFSEMPIYTRLQQYHFNQKFEKWASQHELHGENLYTGNVSFKRKLYNDVGGFDLTLRLSEDRELGARFEKACAKFVFASDAIAINGSDHVDFESWMEMARRYGGLDWQFARNHAEIDHIDPFFFIFMVNPISRPVFAAVMAFPQVASTLTRTVVKISEAVDKLHMERVAFAGTTLAYGIQYYRGVREEAGSLRAVWKSWRLYLKKRAKSGL